MEQDKALAVLMVEDEPDMASMLKMLLERKFTATVEIAEDCASAREKLESGTFDIITLDYQLPDGDGLELLGEIKKKDNSPPVIMVTGHGNEQTAVNSFKLGANGYVVKDKRLTTMLPDAMENSLSRVALERAERALREGEERYRTIVENSHDLIWMLDLEGRFTFVNPPKNSFRGWYDVTDLTGVHFSRQVHPDDLPRIQKVFEETLAGKPQVYETRAYDEEGNSMVLSVNTVPLYSGDTMVGTLSFGRDITERKRAEEELQVRSVLLEAATDSILMCDLEGNILYANEAAHITRGYSRDEFLGMNAIHELGGNESEKIIESQIKELLDEGKVAFESVSRRKDGSTFPIEIHARTIDIGNQRVVLSIARDITERKRAEEELQRINTELEGYAHSVSHDLKGPLSTIMLGVEMLADSLEGVDTGDVEKMSEIVAAITRNARNAQRRINNLLALAEAGQEPREVSDVDVGEVVEEILEERFHEIEEKDIDVNTSSDLEAVTANLTQIRQVFSNLIGNAIRYNDRENPVIQVSYLGDDKGGAHRYLVRDNGPGIPENIIDRIFLPFTRGESGDTGIGLSIVEKLVKVYGGEIRAYNENGACFEFTLRDF